MQTGGIRVLFQHIRDTALLVMSTNLKVLSDFDTIMNFQLFLNILTSLLQTVMLRDIFRASYKLQNKQYHYGGTLSNFH
jgi:hypothetical protein